MVHLTLVIMLLLSLHSTILGNMVAVSEKQNNGQSLVVAINQPE